MIISELLLQPWQPQQWRPQHSQLPPQHVGVGQIVKAHLWLVMENVIMRTKILTAIMTAEIAVEEHGLVIMNVITLTILLLAPTLMEAIVLGHSEILLQPWGPRQHPQLPHQHINIGQIVDAHLGLVMENVTPVTMFQNVISMVAIVMKDLDLPLQHLSLIHIS